MANQQYINIGSQPNDGKGDSIYAAFQKVNSNFNDLYTLLGFGAGFSVLRLKEAPTSLVAGAILQVNDSGDKLVNKLLVAGEGIQIDTTSSGNQIRFINTASGLKNDRNPTLAADLSGENSFSLINMDQTGPHADYDAVSRKWVYENFISRNGVTQYDNTSTSELVYENSSTIYGNVPLISAPTSSTHLVNKGYVDYWVENGGWPSKVNFFVSTSGDDNRFDIPAYKRGRAWPYAFKTINRAAQAAEQYINSGQIVLGVYQKTITHASGTIKSTVSSVSSSTILTASAFGVRVGIDLDPSSFNTGSDPFIARSIFPGNYIIGARSEAVGLIEAITLDTVNGVEYYDIRPVDYAKTYRMPATPTQPAEDQDQNIVTFTLGLSPSIDIPDFWDEYKFVVSDSSYNVIAQGIIKSINTVYTPSGNIHDTITVDFTDGIPLTSFDQIASDDWHVFAADFELAEELQWGQKQVINQSTIIVESGEHKDQYPIKLPENCSIRGDEFRRTVIKPAPLFGTRLPGISSSKWANTYFYRDVQVDGLITAQISTGTDYASAVGITLDGISNDPNTGYIIGTLASGSAPTSWIGKVFQTTGSVDAIGEITEVNGSTFAVNLAQNNTFVREATGYVIGNTIASGSWHVYAPINYGYHYLRDASRPVDTLTTQTNGGGLNLAAVLLEENRKFIQEETIAFVNSAYPSLVYDEDKCYRDVGLIVDALAHDMRAGGNNWTINAADTYRYVAEVQATELAQTVDAFNYINQIGQDIINNVEIVSLQSNVDQYYTDLNGEAEASAILADLVQSLCRIVNNDPDFNPPKYNDELDVILMNDGTINRYISAQGHGGFMKVLDPDGQILAKSPYTQTCSSFSKSKNRQVFSGGMFVDGFAGNTIAMPASVSNNSAGQPVKITVSTTGGLGRPSILPGEGYIKPQVPCFFVHRGVTHEVSFISEWDEVNGTGSLNINPLRPGGIASVTNVAASGFKTGGTVTIPVRFSSPVRAGGLTSTGTAVINSSGQVTGINISFPGSGYINGTYTSVTSGAPTISIGGARLTWTLNGAGAVTNYTVIDGGQGYAAGTVINFPASSTTATAVVNTVDGNGTIQTVTITNAGQGYLSDPTVTFGAGLAYTVTVTPGFIVTTDHPLPSEVTLVTAGNRSMLANDYTQMNDLGYGVFATNGGLIENVSMFTYYCQTSYYALNGAILRTITGSSAYGNYGLVAEGSDPNEVPIAIRNKYAMNQTATVNAVGTYTNAAGDFTIYVDGLSYPPLPQSQIEINHKGIVQNYNVKSALQDPSDPNVYSLSIDDGTGNGLVLAAANNDPVTIRQYYTQTLLDVNPTTLGRPSTALTYREDPTYVYRVLSYTSLGIDAALAESNTPYNYILLTPYTEGSIYRQGLGNITITSGGSGYTPGAQITASIPAPSAAGTATIDGTATNTDLITISSASGNIMVGSRVTLTSGGTDPNGAVTYVTWVNSANTQIRVDRTWTWTNGVGLTFSGTQATGYGLVGAGGTITSLVLTNQGAGYEGTSVRNITFASGTATATAYADGIAGVKKIKVNELDATEQARISTGLANGYYYTFGFEGNIYKITAYTPSATTGNEWGEISVERLSDAAALQHQVLSTTLKAGIVANQEGDVTVRISTLRATSHDMVDIGTGGYADTKYPNDLYGPPNNPHDTAKETKEINKGRVYFVTVDQDGNFKVGSFFGVDQGRGSVSISAPISLTNVDGLSFKRGQSLVQQFTVDGTMGGNSNSSVPTERAVVSYVNNRLGLNRNNTTAGVSPVGNGFLDLGGVLTMKADIKMGTYKVTGAGDPTSDQDVVTKKWADIRYINTSGDTMVGTLTSQNVEPSANNTYSLGATGARFLNMYSVNSYATNFNGTATTALTFNTPRTISFTGDVTGSFVLDGSQNTGTALTIASSIVELGADTTGSYVATIAGTTNQVTVTGSGSESAAVTLSLPQNIHTSASPTFTGITVSSITKAGSDGTGDIGQSGNKFGTMYGTAYRANYADLAEKYLPDAEYAPGTVLVFGGEQEVTISTEYMDRRIAGVVSTNPATLMNDALEGGVAVALTGRVPCNVVGNIKKGDMLIASGLPGVATSEKNPALGSVIGKALENYNSDNVGVIEVVVGRI
jgi:hypothetical protein